MGNPDFKEDEMNPTLIDISDFTGTIFESNNIVPDNGDKTAFQLYVIGEIKRIGLKNFLESTGFTDERLLECFKARSVVGCMDEGVTKFVGMGEGGSGLTFIETFGFQKGLTDHEAVEAGLAAAFEHYTEAEVEIEGFCSHAECGAANFIFGKLSDSYKNFISIFDADEFGKWFIKRLADSLKIPYLDHIELHLMNRESGHHHAGLCYVSTSPKFDPDNGGLPEGFQIFISRNKFEHTLFNIRLCATIAMGSHGLGSEITAERPFTIVFVDDDSVNNIDKEDFFRKLQNLVLDPEYQGKLNLEYLKKPEMEIV